MAYRDAAPADADPVPTDARAPAVIFVAAGGAHTCVVFEAGSVRCWGRNSHGQLGYGHSQDLGDDETPVEVGNVDVGARVTTLALGLDHTCALTEHRDVRCWGNGPVLGYSRGEDVGDDEVPAFVGPVYVGGPVQQIASHSGHTCALLQTGTVRCWGRNWAGQLGYGHTEPVGDDEPPAVAGDVQIGHPVINVAAGFFQTCALLVGSSIRCWGDNVYGELGSGNTEPIGDDETPEVGSNARVDGSPIQVTTGGAHTCALFSSGSIQCWGRNTRGELGYGHTDNIGDDETPAEAGSVPLGARAVQIVAGANHTCALLESGSVRCWGANEHGCLGYGHTRDIGDDETPESAGDLELGGRAHLLAAGAAHTCALLDSGALRCWGRGSWGRLGYADTLGTDLYGEPNDVGDDETPAAIGDVPLH